MASSTLLHWFIFVALRITSAEDVIRDRVRQHLLSPEISNCTTREHAGQPIRIITFTKFDPL